MADKNMQLRKKNGDNWDNIYPISKADNILFEDGESLQVKLDEGALGSGGSKITESESNIENVTNIDMVIGETVEIEGEGEVLAEEWTALNNQVATNKNDIVVINESLSELATKNEVGDTSILLTEDKSNLVNAVNELFTNVSNGKTLLADAITDKGIETSAEDTFDTMVANINKLSKITIDNKDVNGDVSLEYLGYKEDVIQNLPYSFTKGIALIYNNEINILGGSSSNSYHYRWDGSSWTKVSLIPYFAYYKTGGVVYKGNIHLFGTLYSDGDYTKQHYVWDGTSWSKSISVPYAPCNINVTEVYNEEIYTILNYNFFYKWDGSTWIKIGTTPDGASNAIMKLYKGELHLLFFTTHYKWTGETWTKVGDLPTTFNSNFVATVYKGELHVFQPTDNTMSTHYKWDGSSWTQLTDVNLYLYGNSLLVYDNVIYSFYDEDVKTLTEVYRIKANI